MSNFIPNQKYSKKIDSNSFIEKINESCNKIESNLKDTPSNFLLISKGLDTISTQIAQIAVKTKGKINIYEYENLVVGEDWTNAIHQAIRDCSDGSTIYFPEGVYYHTGITVPQKYLNFLGSGRFGTFLQNMSKNPAITILPSAERGSFKDMAIMGNGNLIYGSDATSGHGIVFSENSVSWNFENVTVRGHGGNGFHGGSLGHVNNINIMNSEIEFNRGSGIHFVPVAGFSQINAINVMRCNISNNGGSGLELWGNNINISENSVQGNRKYGYDINSDHVTGTGSLSCDSISIRDNYSELNLFGLLNIKVDKINSPLTYKYIGTFNFERNYGTENVLHSSVKSLIKIQKGNGLSQGVFDRPIKVFSYSKNALYPPDNINIIDGGNLLYGNSEIYNNSDDGLSVDKYINLGWAKFIPKIRTKVLNSYLVAKGVAFTDVTTGKSENITSTKSIIYPFDIEDYNGIDAVGIPIDTNYPSPKIEFNFYGRSMGSKVKYSLIQTLKATSLANGILSATTDDFISFLGFTDLYLELKITPGKGGNNLYVYNPVIIYA